MKTRASSRIASLVPRPNLIDLGAPPIVIPLFSSDAADCSAQSAPLSPSFFFLFLLLGLLSLISDDQNKVEQRESVQQFPRTVKIPSCLPRSNFNLGLSDSLLQLLDCQIRTPKSTHAPDRPDLIRPDWLRSPVLLSGPHHQIFVFVRRTRPRRGRTSPNGRRRGRSNYL